MGRHDMPVTLNPNITHVIGAQCIMVSNAKVLRLGTSVPVALKVAFS